MESKRNETFGIVIFWKNIIQRLGVHVRRASRRPGDRRGPPTGRAPLSCGPLEHLPTDFFRQYMPTYPKTIKKR